jgi:hypothetical protein
MSLTRFFRSGTKSGPVEPKNSLRGFDPGASSCQIDDTFLVCGGLSAEGMGDLVSGMEGVGLPSRASLVLPGPLLSASSP